MESPASLSLEIRWDGHHIAGVNVDSGRPVLASRVLEGRSIADALVIVPRLFSVCRRAQSVAAAVACELASRGTIDASSLSRAEPEVLAECALESLWWLLVEWPARIGQPARADGFAPMRASVLRSLEAEEPSWGVVADELAEFLSTPGYRDALEPTMNELCERSGDGPASTLLPWLDASALRDDIAPSLSDDFARAPLWHGLPAETGALARSRNASEALHSPASRVAARIAELAGIASRMRTLAAGEPAAWVRGAAVREGCALAAVETARGTLVHAVELQGDIVRRWRIVAPTEWNFHPAGAFAQGLVGQGAASAGEAQRAAERLACALDPCVEYRVAVAHA